MKALAVLLLAIACSDPGSTEYVQSWREQFPSLSERAPDCVTVWSYTNDCMVMGTDAPSQCVATHEPMIVRRDHEVTCYLGFNNGCDCAHQELAVK